MSEVILEEHVEYDFFVAGLPIASSDDATVCDACLTTEELIRAGEDPEAQVWEVGSGGWTMWPKPCERCGRDHGCVVHVESWDERQEEQGQQLLLQEG